MKKQRGLDSSLCQVLPCDWREGEMVPGSYIENRLAKAMTLGETGWSDGEWEEWSCGVWTGLLFLRYVCATCFFCSISCTCGDSSLEGKKMVCAKDDKKFNLPVKPQVLWSEKSPWLFYTCPCWSLPSLNTSSKIPWTTEAGGTAPQPGSVQEGKAAATCRSWSHRTA